METSVDFCSNMYVNNKIRLCRNCENERLLSYKIHLISLIAFIKCFHATIFFFVFRFCLIPSKLATLYIQRNFPIYIHVYRTEQKMMKNGIVRRNGIM